MKRNKIMVLASVLLVAVLLTTSIISGTFAKYVTEANGEDAARVAKWDIQLSGDQMTAEHEMSFDLFANVKDESGADENAVSVAGDGETAIIAPGTSGSFSYTLQNASEVTAKYVIDYTVVKTDSNIPIVFRASENDSWTSDINDLDISTAVNMPIGSAATTFTVYWKWAFDGGVDSTDTALGLDGDDTVTVSVKITATQVNLNETEAPEIEAPSQD